jgi:hypothetical protein
MLSASDLTALRTDLATSLPGTAVISRFTASSDGQGGQTQLFAASGTVACRLSPRIGATGTEEVNADRLQTIQYDILTVPANTDLDVKDRVVTGGITYEVVNIRAPRSYEWSRRAEIVRVD